jgi:hypothetical protein
MLLLPGQHLLELLLLLLPGNHKWFREIIVAIT